MSFSFQVRPYLRSDEQSWLRCRVLSFLGSSYFDDVKRSKTVFGNPSFELVAIDPQVDNQVVGLLDLEIFGELATIDSVAVHPDYARQGIAAALWAKALEQVPSSVTHLDAWTREDEAANRWYQSQGFELDTEYLHVFYEAEESGQGITVPPGLRLETGFLHAELRHETQLRKEFGRVYRCRRYLRRSR